MIKPKKICFFVPRIVTGGLVQVMLTLAEAFADKGYSIDLATIHQSWPNDLKHLIPKNTNLIHLTASRPTTAIWPLVKHLKKSKPDVLISAGAAANYLAMLAKILAFSSTKTILTEHSQPSVDIFKSKKLIDKVIPFFMRRLYPRADFIVAVSHSVARDLSTFIRYPLEKIYVIYNPIVNSKLTELSFAKLDHPWFKEKQYPIVLFVGRFSDVKNIPLLVNAFSLVRKSYECKLVLVGDGPERENLQSLVRDLALSKDTLLINYCPNPYPYMRHSNVLVLTSKWEGLGNVLIEAMACGTPVIATDNLESAREILDNGKFGVLTPNNNVKILADNIVKAIQYEAAPKNIKERANIFSVDTSVDQYLRLFDP